MLKLGKDEQNDVNVDLETVSINNDYSMGIPTYMTKAKSLNDEASLQFQNMFKETYVVVIDENKQEYVDAYKELSGYDTTRSVLLNYADTQMQLTTANLDVVNKTRIAPLKINGLSAATTEIDANIEGVRPVISYFLTFIEGKEKIYMIMAWTLQDKKETHRATFERMARSFKTIESPLVLGNR